MSTKTRPACKVRAGDVIDFGGQPATVTDSHDCYGDHHLKVEITGAHGEMYVAPDVPLNVQRRKVKSAKAVPVLVGEAGPELDAPPVPGKVYTLGPFDGPMPSVAELNAVFAEAIGTLLRERTE